MGYSWAWLGKNLTSIRGRLTSEVIMLQISTVSSKIIEGVVGYDLGGYDLRGRDPGSHDLGGRDLVGHDLKT